MPPPHRRPEEMTHSSKPNEKLLPVDRQAARQKGRFNCCRWTTLRRRSSGGRSWLNWLLTFLKIFQTETASHNESKHHNENYQYRHQLIKFQSRSRLAAIGKSGQPKIRRYSSGAVSWVYLPSVFNSSPVLPPCLS